VDVTDGRSRMIYRSQDPMTNPSVSPDGKKIAYCDVVTEWNVLEVTVADGRVRTVVVGGGASWQPDWAPSGTHFLFVRFDGGTHIGIEDRSAAEGFSRSVVEAHWDGLSGRPRWAPDGTRFLFKSGRQLMVTDAAGVRQIALAEIGASVSFTWSPDGQWIAFERSEGGKPQLVKMKPLAGATAIPLTGRQARRGLQFRDSVVAQGKLDRLPIAGRHFDGLARRRYGSQADRRNLMGFAFSGDGSQVYGVFRNTIGESAQWQLYTIDVKTGAEKMLAPLDLPASTDSMVGFSLHRDGKRFLTSIGRWPWDIWMLEGWDQPQKTGLDRLLRRRPAHLRSDRNLQACHGNATGYAYSLGFGFRPDRRYPEVGTCTRAPNLDFSIGETSPPIKVLSCEGINGLARKCHPSLSTSIPPGYEDISRTLIFGR
jgi:dipeptidyl aminopeptidase/acylaminoacyl peptidase